jgi:thiosulfate/3-mercaptopyruvate sulfurtransferase
MNGGRAKWEQEKRPLVKETPSYARTTYSAKDADKSIRAFRDEVLTHSNAKKPLVDVRSPKEFTGEMLHMPNYPQEGATRGGHIPGAVSIPWSQAVNEADATFKTSEKLTALYEGKNIKADGDVIAYCRIGERSSLTWFVLKYLLGYPKVKNYDGSWTEWGNLVDAPIEK